MANVSARNIAHLGPEVGHKPTKGELVAALHDGEPVTAITIQDDEGLGYLLLKSDTIAYAADTELRHVGPLKGTLIFEPLDLSAPTLPKAQDADRSGLLVANADNAVVLRLVLKDGDQKRVYQFDVATGEGYTKPRLGLSSGFRILLERDGAKEPVELTRIA